VRRARSLLVASWLLGASWLGCNAILGNESASFAPDASVSADGALGPDGSSDGATGPDGAGDSAPPCTIDTTSDPQNCGVCGHDCLGGGCEAGRCEPVVLATDVGGLASGAIALDDAYVYWTNGATGTVARVPIDGGLAELLLDSTVGAGATMVVPFGSNIYIGSTLPDAGVFACPKTGCGDGGLRFELPHLTYPGSLSIDDGGVLSVAEFQSPGRVLACHLPCGTSTVLDGGIYPGAVVGLGSSVYWSQLVTAELWGSIAGGPPNLLLSGPNGVVAVDLHVAGNEVVFDDQSKGPAAISLDGGALRRILQGVLETNHAAVDDTFVYFNSDPTSASGQILRCPIAGVCTSGVVIADNRDQAGPLAVDGTYVYWLEDDNDAGRVVRVAK
jgi:hypothetical protein